MMKGLEISQAGQPPAARTMTSTRAPSVKAARG